MEKIEIWSSLKLTESSFVLVPPPQSIRDFRVVWSYSMCREFSWCLLSAFSPLSVFAYLNDVGLRNVYDFGCRMLGRDSLADDKGMRRLDLVRRRPKVDLRLVVLGR